MPTETKVHRKVAAPKPASARMADMRERKREAGFAPMEVWAHPDDHQAIREYAATLANARFPSAEKRC